MSCIAMLSQTRNVDVYNKCLIAKDQAPSNTDSAVSCDIDELIKVAKFSSSVDTICPIETPNLVCKNNHWYCQ